MAFTDLEKAKVREHLGYPQAQPAAAIVYGIPAANQTSFLVELAMEKLLATAEGQVREFLSYMDGIDRQIVEATGRLAASAIKGLKLREDEIDRLQEVYVMWGYRLADVLGVPVYHLSRRYMGAGSRGAGNVSVSG